jgi:hypothetical protein
MRKKWQTDYEKVKLERYNEFKVQCTRQLTLKLNFAFPTENWIPCFSARFFCLHEKVAILPIKP